MAGGGSRSARVAGSADSRATGPRATGARAFGAGAARKWRGFGGRSTIRAGEAATGAGAGATIWTGAARTNAVRTNAVRTNAVRTNAVRTNEARTGALRTGAGGGARGLGGAVDAC